MKLVKIVLYIACLHLLSGCIVIAKPSYADHHTQKILEINASSLTLFDIEAGAGTLVITGSDDISEIRVVADIYMDKQDTDNYQLELSNSGNTAFLVAKVKSHFGSWIGDSPHINLNITVPTKMMLDVDDGSGELTIKNINNNVKINDGSGALKISNVKGELDINDGSGSIDIKNVFADVMIVDGSGGLEVSNVKGNLDINDGSGSINVKNITGNAIFEDDSGNLTVKNVSETVTIDDGSGAIDVNQVGALKIINIGSGALRVKNVAGEFEIND